jgi:signal peptidase II
MNPVSFRASLGFLLLTLSLPLYLIDQATKILVHRLLGDPLEVIPGFFQLVYVTNTGAAFGLGKDNNYFFVGLSIVAAVAIFWLNRSGVFAGRWQRWGVALLVAGLAGNLTDRLFHGHVIDFLYFQAGPGGPHWPAFNVADSCICVAVVCFLWSSIKELKSPEPARPQE